MFQKPLFDALPDVRPQQDYRQATVQDFLVNNIEFGELCMDYMVLWLRTVVKLVPAFQFLKPYVPKMSQGEYSEQLKEKTEVVPLEVLFLNEQYYADVAQILHHYAQTVESVFDEANVELTPSHKVPLGGDQLTRERFSGAMNLMIGAPNDRDAYKHLGPVTFEFFHMMMAYLQLMFDKLYNEDSVEDIGTIKAEAVRTNMINVSPKVKDSYDADKDFIKSYVDAHIVEATLEYFGMDNINSPPTKHQPPTQPDEIEKWMSSTFTKLVKGSVWPSNRDMNQPGQQNSSVEGK